MDKNTPVIEDDEKIIGNDEKHLTMIVEDNEKYLAAAQEAAKNTGVMEAVFCTDYIEAMKHLPKAECALIDLFFKEEAGTGKVNMGYYALGKITKAILKIDIMDVLKEEAKPVYWAIKKVGDLFGSNDFVLDYLGMGRMSNREFLEQNYFDGRLKKQKEALLDIEANMENEQPLGILVAEEAEKLGIPYKFVTSIHHHDKKLEHAINIYVQEKKLGEIIGDSCGSKDDPGFWAKAFVKLDYDTQARRRK